MTETVTCGRPPWVRIAAMVTWRCTATAIAALCGAGLACSPGAEPKATIESVSPPSAYNDVGLSLEIKGGDFRPAYQFDTMAGAASVQQAFSGVLSPAESTAGLAAVVIDPVVWDGARALRATVPAGVAAGVYDVTITDPRGEVITLPAGFTSLGPDLHPPVIVVEHPRDDTIVGAGSEVTVSLSADDGSGSLTTLTWSVTWSAGEWKTGTCEVGAGASSMLCSFRFMAPPLAAGSEPMAITLAAVDSMSNVDPVIIPLLLAPRPTLITLSAYNGAAGGKQPIVVTGTGFVPSNGVSFGSMVVVDGQRLETVFKSETELEATTVPHDPGLALVSVRTGGASSPRSIMFQFYAAPLLKAIEPQSGPEAGGNPVTIVGRHFTRDTKIFFTDGGLQSEELGSPLYRGPSRIDGFAPRNPTSGPIVHVFARDPIGGIGQLLGAYVYESSP